MRSVCRGDIPFSSVITQQTATRMALVERARAKNPVRDVEGWQDQENRGKTRIDREVVELHESNTPQTVIEYSPAVREHWAPFDYDNFRVELGRTDPYVGADFDTDGVELDVPPYGAITVLGDEPIVGVDVIGSAVCRQGT